MIQYYSCTVAQTLIVFCPLCISNHQLNRGGRCFAFNVITSVDTGTSYFLENSANKHPT